MKYFKKELWAAANSENEAKEKHALRQWNRNLKAYVRQVEKLKPRLTKAAYRFFTKENLHDGRLLSFTTGDDIDYDLKLVALNSRNRGEPSVTMSVLNYTQDALYILKYKKLRKILFDFPTEEPLFYQEGDSIHDWGYEELTSANRHYLRHEVLFSSGATILMEFQNFSYKKVILKNSKGPVF